MPTSGQVNYPVPVPTGGTPSGANTQVQFNDAGAFAGDAGLTYNKTTDVLTVGKQLSISSGAVTTSAPVLDLAQTWNAGAVTFTGVKVNVTDTASAAASSLLDLQVGGSSKFSVSKAGAATAVTEVLSGQSLTGSSAATLLDMSATWNTSGTPSAVKLNVTDTASNANSLLMDLQVGGASKLRSYKDGGLVVMNNAGVNNSGYIGVWSAGQIGFSNAASWSNSAALDAYFSRDAANTISQRGGTSAQMFRIYGTTDAGTTNYERAKFGWSGSGFFIGTERGGTGVARGIDFQVDATTCLTINSSGNFVFADAKNLAFGTGTGTKIGSGSTQKLGFFGATPVVQQTAVADATDAASVITQLNALLARMRTLGFIAP